MTSNLYTAKMAREIAEEVAIPKLNRLLEAETDVVHTSVHLVFLDPTVRFGTGVQFADAILYQHQNGHPKQKYVEVSLSKAHVSWATGLPSHEVQQMYPYLLEDDDTKWGGSAARDFLVISCSGLPWQYDWSLCDSLITEVQERTRSAMREVLGRDSVTFMREFKVLTA